MNPSIPITDNHMHVDPRSGLGSVEVAKIFARVGGTHLMVVNKMVADWGLRFGSLEEFDQACRFFLDEVGRINSETTVHAFAVIGPHPVELVRLWEGIGPSRAVACMEESLRRSVGLVREGKAVALGEVGRPHFPVPDPILEASNHLLDLTLQLAADAGCPVQLHMESGTAGQYEELAHRARAAGLPPEKVIRHFSPPLIDVGERTGIMPSVLSTRRNMVSALSQGDRFLMETDFIDDRRRPGAVLGPKSVPRLTAVLLAQGKMSEESAFAIHKTSVERAYGIEICL